MVPARPLSRAARAVTTAAPDRDAPSRRSDRAIVGLLAVLIAFQPLSTDLVIASLPGLARHFDVGAATVQATLSVFIGAFAVTQLLAGPLSDRFGRRPVVLAGVAAYVAGSALGALAGSLETLLAGRALQAVGTCCTVVCARAIVRDRFAPTEGARRLAHAMSWVALMPIGAPVLGGAIEGWTGWRGTFWTMAAFGAIALVACATGLRESHRDPDPAAMRPGPMATNYLEVLRSPAWAGFALYGAAMYWGLFAFLSESAFVFGRVHGMSPPAIGLAVSTITSGFLLGTLAARRLLPRLGVQRMLGSATVVAVGAALAMLALALAGVSHVAAVLVPQCLFVFAHGLSQSSWQAGAVAPFPRQAGAAAALTGFVQNALAVGSGLIVGRLHDGTVVPMAAMVAAGGLAAMVVARTLVRRHGDVDRAAPATASRRGPA